MRMIAEYGDGRVYSPRVGQALQFAAELHADQRRKGKDEPYLSHLLRVASLVAHHGGDEDQIVAAALHDAVEDRGGTPILATIDKVFGHDVAHIVAECSDSITPTGQAKAPWRERKEAYLRHVGHRGPDRASLVEASDKLANLQDLVEDYADDGEESLTRFAGGPDGVRWYYQRLQEVLMPQAPRRLAREFAALLPYLRPARVGETATSDSAASVAQSPIRDLSI